MCVDVSLGKYVVRVAKSGIFFWLAPRPAALAGNSLIWGGDPARAPASRLPGVLAAKVRYFWGRQHSHAGCLVALGPVLRRRRTYDRCFERCAPAVPQHDRPRASTIPLPAHSPCTAASEQSPAAIDPCGDVGCLAGFRQEGSPPYMPCMRYNIKGDTKNWNSLTRYMIRADLDCVFGKS